MIFNDSRVMPARLCGVRDDITAGNVEFLLDTRNSGGAIEVACCYQRLSPGVWTPLSDAPVACCAHRMSAFEEITSPQCEGGSYAWRAADRRNRAGRRAYYSASRRSVFRRKRNVCTTLARYAPSAVHPPETLADTGTLPDRLLPVRRAALPRPPQACTSRR